MNEQNINLKTYEVNLNDATPMLRQYLNIKKDYQGVILFYRMGDFYETFFEDAVTAAKDLEITLTRREGGNLGKIPMAGIPVKAVDNYVSKLLEKGHKIAICEQTEDPSTAKGLVERKVVRTITAGTITESNLLNSTKNNYLAAVIQDKKSEMFGFAYVDISTGEFKITQANYEELLSELSRVSPSEVIAPVKQQKVLPFQIVPEEVIDLPDAISNTYNCTKIGYSAFNEQSSIKKISELFKVKSLEAFGYPEYKLGITAAGAILEYLAETQMQGLPDFDVIIPYTLSSFVAIDMNTRKNLELVETFREKSYKGSLYWAINKTNTNMGARLLRKWIQQPLQNLDEIKNRQNSVEELLNNSILRIELASLLNKTYDMERLSSRISNNSANGRDFIALKDSLNLLPDIANLLTRTKSPLLFKLSKLDKGILEFAEIIEKTIADEPPVGIKEGNLIKGGVNKDLDYLKDLLKGGQNWLESFENKIKDDTGIKSLKVGYSKNFGFFIEVTHANTNLVPEYFIRKQTLTNAERYITPELKEHESEVLSAQTRSIDLEYQIFVNLRDYAKEFVQPIRDIAKALSEIDVLLSFAITASEFNYTRPEVDNSYEILIKDGRHPVIEQLLPMGNYISNDLMITGGDFYKQKNNPMFVILTGPNMAGKSTYMRQNALLVILAQIGSFVPASAAKIGIVDKIFTRVGAVDDLSMGQSTFMVEMNETALILNSATDRSFILLDEIGRGTSTYDGVAIAWSVAEAIAEDIKARTIFATHYHELNVMSKKIPQIENFQITVTEINGKIEFLRKVIPGGTNKSYGIQVAKMAGLPNSVINRAEMLMRKMQKDYTAKISGNKKQESIEVQTPQLSLFIE